MTKRYVAFDYEKQDWVTGEPARLLLLEQNAKTRAVILGPRGEDYLRGIGLDREQALGMLDDSSLLSVA